MANNILPLSNLVTAFENANILTTSTKQATRYSQDTLHFIGMHPVLKISVPNQNHIPMRYESFIIDMQIKNDPYGVCIVVTDANNGTKYIKSFDEDITYFDQQSNVDQIVTDIVMSCNAYMFANK